MSRTSKIILGALLAIHCTSLMAKPLVIAHRGASGYLPEHSLEAAILAYSQGADFIEQDLVLSKDNVPIVLHDIYLESVTNVEQVFPERARKDGRFYAIDFTVAEIQSLQKHERTNAQGQQVFPGRYEGLSPFKIATFEQQIQLIAQLNEQFNKNVGIYPEIKSPAWHLAQGVDISKIVIEILRRYDLDHPDKNVYVQCFDFAETKRIRNELGLKAKLVQLFAENNWGESTTDYDYLKTAAGLTEIAKVAQGIGPWMPQLFDVKAMKPTDLAPLAKSLNLQIHPFTFRVDALPKGLDSETTLNILFENLKVDGIFTDFTDVVVKHLQTENQKND